MDRIHDGRDYTLTQARNAPVHPLRGLVFCGYCGHAMVRRPAKQGKYLYYACKSTLSPHIYCPARPRYVPGIDLEAKVLERAIEYVRSNELDEAYANYLSTKDDSLEAVYVRISKLRKEKKLMEGRKQRLVDAIAIGVLSHDEAKGKLEEIRFAIERIKGKIVSLENVPIKWDGMVSPVPREGRCPGESGEGDYFLSFLRSSSLFFITYTKPTNATMHKIPTNHSGIFYLLLVYSYRNDCTEDESAKSPCYLVLHVRQFQLVPGFPLSVNRFR